MADMSRVQKLASARKKLRQYQKAKKPTPATVVNLNDTDNLYISQEKKIPASSISKTEVGQTDPFCDPPGRVLDNIVEKFQNHCEDNETAAHLFHEANNISDDFLIPTVNVASSEKYSHNNSSQPSDATVASSILDKPEYSLPTAAEKSPLDDSTKQLKLEFSSPSSSTESLRQISLQLNGLINASEQFLNGDGENLDFNNRSELESRNQELASIIQQQKQIVQQLSSEVEQLRDQNSVLQIQLDEGRRDLESQSLKEQTSLKEQLQVHIQTIGILVAEKTELQSALTQNQRAVKQKTGEVEELDGRLKASRHRLNDLDKELQTVKCSRDQFENDSKEHSKEADRLKLELYKLRKSSEENSNENLELAQKLQIKAQDCNKLETELSELRKKLSLTELRVQQLSSSNSSGYQSQLEELNEKNIELESKLSQYQEAFQKLSTERDNFAEQYQQYIQQLNQQITSVRDELNAATDDCMKLKEENEQLSDQLENNRSSVSGTDCEELKNVVAENVRLSEEIKDLETKHKEIQKQLESQMQDNNQISQMMEEKEYKLQELEGAISRLQEEEVDKEKLLDTIQSDKVAASRAMAQNKQLKKQLEELQEGFVQMSNDKLEITERMITQQYTCKELGEQMSQQAEEIANLKQNLLNKNEEIETLSKDVYQHNQIQDRMRHFEAQGKLSEVLQTELNQAQERISALTTQNNELRSMLTQQAENLLHKTDFISGDSETKKDNIVASLSASVQQLELERDQLLRQLEEQKSNHRNIHDTIQKYNTTSGNKDDKNGFDDNLPDENFALKDTLVKLETKLKRTMTEIAELSDQKQQLEHLVLQLQGETETIGDYIALYQVQRGLMKKWAAEKDEYIAQLSRDRENLKAKLNQLQSLIVNLVNKKQVDQEHTLESISNSSRTASPLHNSYHINGALSQDGETQKEWDTASNISSNASTLPSSHMDNQAKKIIDLISDIGNTALVDKPVLDTFHPCACCSGRLINV